MAGFDVRGELLIGGEWVDATGELLKRQALTHSRGRRDQASRVDPSTLQPLLNNTNGQFSPDNPSGPYYGMFGRNTPFRLSVRAGSSRLVLPANTNGSRASTPDDPAISITGAIDIRIDVHLTNWGSGQTVELAGKYVFSTPQRSWLFQVGPSGELHFRRSADGAAFTDVLSSVPVPIPASGRLAVRVTYDPAGTHHFYTAPEMAGPWTQLGDEVAGTAGAIFDSTAPLEIGDVAQLGFTEAEGAVYAFQLRDGIDGLLVADVDFTALAEGTTAFVDDTGLSWTLANDAEITNRRTRLIHELAAYPTRWHPSGAHAWVEATTAGVLRRLRRGNSALESTLRRRVPSFSPLAYWPLEEGENATRAYSPLPGVGTLRLTNVSWASVDSLPSSRPLPALNGSTGNLSHMAGSFPNPSFASLDGWNVEWLYRLDTPNTTLYTFMRVLSLGTVREWYIQSRNDLSRIIGKDSEGATVFSQDIGTSEDLYGRWIRTRFSVAQEGGNVRWTIVWADVNGDGGFFTNTFAGDAGRPTGVASPPGGFGHELTGMALGHIAVFDVEDSNAFDRAASAWAGETAGERMQRLAEEESYPVIVAGTDSELELVGPQLPSPILDLLEEAADADGGILYEDREVLRLRYRGRSTMYTQRPALVLDYNQPGLAPPLEPTGDDDATENDVTVIRTNGSSGRAVLEEGPLSVLSPPDGVGPYPSQVTLNLYEDAQAEPQAYWRLHHGTYEGRRYPQVRVMVHKAPPELLDQILAVDIGDRLVIKNPPIWVAPGDIELIVQGYDETWASPFQWDIIFNCTPGVPWLVGAVEEPTYGRVDTDGSELAAAVDADDTTLTVLASDGPVWVKAAPSMITNYHFEDDLTGWAGNGATIERLPTPAGAPFTGEWSMRLTPDGVAAFPNAGADLMPVTPGQVYTLSGWQMCEVTRSVDLNINWFDGTGAYLSTSAGGQAVTAGEWAWFEVTATAPVGAAFANGSPTVPTSPPVTDRLWSDMVTMRPTIDAQMPQEFPGDIQVGGEEMTVTAITDSRTDTFARTVAGGWGTADSGQAWTVVGSAADYSVGAGYGVAAQPATGIAHITLLPAPGPDVDLYLDVASSTLATGASLFTGPLIRATDNNNHYQARIEFTTGAGVWLTLRERVGGVETVLGSYTSTLTHVAGAWYRVRLQAYGSALKTKVWLATDDEPEAWQIEVTDTSLTGAASVGTRAYRNTGNTNAGAELRFDNLRVANPQTFTVGRSANGVVKAHAAGTDVRLAHPTIVAL